MFKTQDEHDFWHLMGRGDSGQPQSEGENFGCVSGAKISHSKPHDDYLENIHLSSFEE